MTLILTELTNVGIVMVTDSAISEVLGDGTVKRANYSQWEKLIRVPSITAAVTYWGTVGRVPTSGQDFPDWLRSKIDRPSKYDDLSTLAAYLRTELNAAFGNKTLAPNVDVGLHVAGFYEWPDKTRGPAVFHVHNRHSHYEYTTKMDANGNSVIKPIVKGENMSTFKDILNFPRENVSTAANRAELEQPGGFLLRNGDYSVYAIVGEKLTEAFGMINALEGVSIPRKANDLSSRKDFLEFVLRTMIQIYQKSTLTEIIGLPITSVGISPTEYVI